MELKVSMEIQMETEKNVYVLLPCRVYIFTKDFFFWVYLGSIIRSKKRISKYLLSWYLRLSRDNLVEFEIWRNLWTLEKEKKKKKNKKEKKKPHASISDNLKERYSSSLSRGIQSRGRYCNFSDLFCNFVDDRTIFDGKRWSVKCV